MPNRDAMKLYQELQEVLSARNILVALQSALIYEQISKHKRAAGALKKSAFWGTGSILGQVGGRGPGLGWGGGVFQKSSALNQIWVKILVR